MQQARGENEKKKEYLRSYQKHIRRIRRIESDLEEIASMKQYPSMKNDGMPRASGGSGDLSGYAAVVDAKERELKEEKESRVRSYQEIGECIDSVQSEKERDVLHYRYIKGLDWYEIAEKMNYSERQIHRLHGRALANFKCKN